MLNKEDIQKIGLFEDAIHNAINQVLYENPDISGPHFLNVALASVFRLRAVGFNFLFLNIDDVSKEYLDSVYSKTLENSSVEEIDVYKKMMIKISNYELPDLVVRRCLENHGIKYLGDLCVLSPGSLINLKGFESPWLLMIRRALMANGLDFCTNFKCWPTIRKQMENKND